MHVHRICRAPFKALDGEGAHLYGGRWNSPGHGVVYTSSTLALAALEYLIHVQPATAPRDLVALKIDVPDDAPTQRVDIDSLRRGWDRPLGFEACREIGDEWVKAGRTLVLFVPAVPVPEEFNVLLNPAHELMPRVRIVGERPFSFDARLL